MVFSCIRGRVRYMFTILAFTRIRGYVPRRVIRGKIGLFTRRRLSSYAMTFLITYILPRFACGGNVQVFILGNFTRVFGRRVKGFVYGVGSPAQITTFRPFSSGTIFTISVFIR